MSPLLNSQAVLNDRVTEKAVRFEVGDRELVGNLVLPSDPRNAVVVFVHGWSGVRCGPNRLLTKLARKMGDHGWPSLRFDLGGRGESGGDGMLVSLASMADDLTGAVDFALETFDAHEVVLVGMCSGGNVAIGTLPRLPNVRGMLLFSVYPFSDGDSFGRDMNRTLHHLRIYWNKLGSAQTWQRFIQGDLNFRQIARVLFGHFRKRRLQSVAPEEKKSTAAGKASAAAAVEGRHSASPPRAHLEKLKAAGPVLMIYGTGDPDAGAARQYYQSFSVEHRLPVIFHEIAGANHNFSSQEWESSVYRLSLEFINGLPHPPA